MANTVFQPYTYEQLYTTAKELTAAHNEQESKLGALDTAAAGVEPYLDPEAHPEDKAMYDAIKGYRNGLNDITYHLASRGLSGHVYNNVMSLASDYANKVKPVEGAVENYKKAHDMRVGILAQNPDYIPRYSWDKVSVSENLNGVSQRAIEGFKGTQYMNDITTTLQKLFNDFGLTKRKDIRIFGQQVFDMISKGMPAETALTWFADQTQLSPEDRAKLMLGLDTVNQRYDINGLQSSNPAIMGELAGYQKQGIINAIGTHELKTYENLWDKVAANVSQARRVKALEEEQPQIKAPLGLSAWTPSSAVQEKQNDNDINHAIELPSWRTFKYDPYSKKKPKEYGNTFYHIMKEELRKINPNYVKFADNSPDEIRDINWWEKNWRGLNGDAQKAYSNAYRRAVAAKSYIQNKEPIKVTIGEGSTINNFMSTFQHKLYKINDDGSIDTKWYSKRRPDDVVSSDFKDPELMDIAFIPSIYSIYNGLENEGKDKNDYIFFKVKTKDKDATTYALPIEEIIGNIGPVQVGRYVFNPNDIVNFFRSFDGMHYDLDAFKAKYPEYREIEEGLTETIKNYIVTAYMSTRAEELKSVK